MIRNIVRFDMDEYLGYRFMSSVCSSVISFATSMSFLFFLYCNFHSLNHFVYVPKGLGICENGSRFWLKIRHMQHGSRF